MQVIDYITNPELSRPIQKHFTNMTNGTRRVEPFWTDIHTVLDAMASENTERIVELRQPLIRRLVAAIRQKPIGL